VSTLSPLFTRTLEPDYHFGAADGRVLIVRLLDELSFDRRWYISLQGELHSVLPSLPQPVVCPPFPTCFALSVPVDPDIVQTCSHRLDWALTSRVSSPHLTTP
jgi:hypothetical protein